MAQDQANPEVTQIVDAGEPVTLYKADPQLMDQLRKEMNAPTLAEAKAREKRMQDRMKGGR